ncbi:GNAT family N-acetyltransferase [Tengunoibacter tsumagoiensis]|uniref:N-acetyltransferase n=1 Tax=Tengunoibacter tsumagoiensis TaxID=2014871 RepID=A0A402A7U6_9CHLR|nr:GNAT family protein [Tengunoibacter tsumagoiensis]GCE15234.1 N-acetyltransferase [Tengunoibacter tsumagoiensis]
MKIEPVELKGMRARLVPLEEAHIPALYATGHDEELWTYSALKATTLEEMSHLVHTFLQDQRRGEALPFAIIDLADQQIVGCTQLHSISQEHRHGEIGKTWLSPHTWGTHLNTECKYLLLRHCFETLAMLRVQFRTDGRNVRSQRAVERLGAVREGVLRHNWVLPNGYVRDTIYYSILLEEWPACKHHVDGMLRSAFKDLM